VNIFVILIWTRMHTDANHSAKPHQASAQLFLMLCDTQCLHQGLSTHVI